jgi:GT2 family glycosyltransferase
MLSLARYKTQFSECIVVDDASTDSSARCAAKYGARVIEAPTCKGPAAARNLGALAAIGDILFFLDADVCVQEDTLRTAARRLEADPDLGAVFGSYDDEPDSPEQISCFRNLLHCFVHQTSKENASTFWAGCGAIRRTIFLARGGFDVSYSIPCVEDIEFGGRLIRTGVRIALDPAIQVKHLKRWTFRKMVVTDTRDRGIPWTRLILQNGEMPRDLNLRFSNQLSVALLAIVCLMSGLIAARFLLGAAATVWSSPASTVLLLSFVVILALNIRFYRFLAKRRNLRFAALSVPLHLVHFFCCGLGLVLGAVTHYRSRSALRSAALRSTR